MHTHPTQRHTPMAKRIEHSSTWEEKGTTEVADISLDIPKSRWSEGDLLPVETLSMRVAVKEKEHNKLVFVLVKFLTKQNENLKEMSLGTLQEKLFFIKSF